MRDIDKYANDYCQEPCEAIQVKYRRKKILEVMKKYSHKVILEIGCGTEPLFEYINDYEKMVIVEPSKEFYERAEARAEKKNAVILNGFLEDKVRDIKKLGLEFDYIVASSLLHEVENPGMLLDSIGELCSDKTVVHINVPNAYSIHRLLALEMGLIDNVHDLSELQIKMQRNRVFDIRSLIDIVEKSQFEVIESGSYFPKFFSARQMESILESNIVSEEIFEGLDKMITYMPDNGSEIYVQAKKG